ncbi:MAG: hypothetical protein WC650_04985 [Candidatus Doudnabacteria bacterium]
MGTTVSKKKTEKTIKHPLVMVVDPRNIVVMKNAILRGKCNDGSPIIQVQGQGPPGTTTKALIIEKNQGWTILPHAEHEKG